MNARRNCWLAIATGAGVLAAGCTAVDTRSADRFSETGQVIAMSGGGAGAANACFTCHGLGGQGDGAGSPRLAGLDPGYLERQLIAYADGRRFHKQMNHIAGELTPRDRRMVATYYASMRFSPGTSGPVPQAPVVYVRGDPGRGLPACASCHGSRGEGIGPANPPLAGQPAAYLAQQMRQWRHSRRRNDPGDVMLRISQLLTPSETLALARYAARLPGGPPSPGPAAASPLARRGDPRSGVSTPPLHVPERARAAE
jgi:cytochrome c553